MSNPFLETASWRTQTDRELHQSSTPSHASPASFLSLHSVAPRAFLTFPPNATLTSGSASWGISLQQLLRKGLHCCTVLILLSHFFLSSHSSLFIFCCCVIIPSSTSYIFPLASYFGKIMFSRISLSSWRNVHSHFSFTSDGYS